MSPELVSVVIPAYNVARYVGEAVDSVLRQTNCQLEVIVVNDGSTDETADVLSRYGDSIRVVSQVNQGLSAARNTGIRHATGEWVSFLDADDYWHPQKTERQLAAVAGASHVGVIGSAGGDFLPDELPLNAPIRTLCVKDFLHRTPITGSSTMVRRKCFDEVGLFDEELRSAEDRDMWLRLAAKFEIRQVDLDCWFYRLHPGQMSRNPERMYVNYRRVLDKFFREHPDQRHLRRLGYGYLYLDAALAYADAEQFGTARRFLLRSMATHPTRLGDDSWRRAKLMVRLCCGSTVVERLKRFASGQNAITGASH